MFYVKLTLDSFSFSVLCAKNLVKKDFFRKYPHSLLSMMNLSLFLIPCFPSCSWLHTACAALREMWGTCNINHFYSRSSRCGWFTTHVLGRRRVSSTYRSKNKNVDWSLSPDILAIDTHCILKLIEPDHLVLLRLNKSCIGVCSALLVLVCLGQAVMVNEHVKILCSLR